MIFAPKESRDCAVQVAEELGRALDEIEEFEFEDGEMKLRPKGSVLRQEVFVIQSLYSEPSCDLHRKIARLLFLIAALKDQGATHVHAAIPYLAYARQDRRDAETDPLTHRYLAAALEASGADSVVSLDVHNPAAFENAFRCRTWNLEMDVTFATHLMRNLKRRSWVVVSPDSGGIKRAKRFAGILAQQLGQEVRLAMADKTRTREGVAMHRLFGEVGGENVILYDDLISTGGTIFQAARLCKEAGAREVIAVATHGLFSGNAGKYLEGPEVDQIVVSDSVAPLSLPRFILETKVTRIPSAPLIAQAIGRLLD